LVTFWSLDKKIKYIILYIMSQSLFDQILQKGLSPEDIQKLKLLLELKPEDLKIKNKDDPPITLTRLEQDHKPLMELAKSYFDENEWQFLSKLLGKKREDIKFIIDEAKILSAGQDQQKEILQGIARLQTNGEYVVQGFPLLQFYDYVQTIDKLNTDIRQLEITIQRLDSLGDKRMLHQLKQKTLTPNFRCYGFSEIEENNPQLLSDEFKTWSKGQELGDPVIYDPYLRAANVFNEITSNMILDKDNRDFDIRPKTPYELCIDEVLLLRPNLLNTLTGLGQGLFRVYNVIAPYFRSVKSGWEEKIDPGEFVSDIKIPEECWINSFYAGDPINLPPIDWDSSSKKWRSVLYLQPKYIELENYPNSWVGNSLVFYGNFDPIRADTEYGFGRTFIGAGEEGKREIDLTPKPEPKPETSIETKKPPAKEIKPPPQSGKILQAHKHDGKGGAIGTYTWSISNGFMNDMKAKDEFKVPVIGSSERILTSFYQLGVEKETQIKATQDKAYDPTQKGNVLCFYPFIYSDIVAEPTAPFTVQKLQEKAKKHKEEYTKKVQSSFANQLAKMNLKVTDDIIPPLALYPPNNLPSCVYRKSPWNFYDVSRIPFDTVSEEMGKLKQHPIFACPRLRKAFHDSGVGNYLKMRIIRVYEDLLSKLKKSSLGVDEGSALQLRNDTKKDVYRFSNIGCGAGLAPQFRNYNNEIIPTNEAVYVGNDGVTYLHSHIQPELTKCVELIPAPYNIQFPTNVRLIGMNEAKNVEQKIYSEVEKLPLKQDLKLNPLSVATLPNEKSTQSAPVVIVPNPATGTTENAVVVNTNVEVPHVPTHELKKTVEEKQTQKPFVYENLNNLTKPIFTARQTKKRKRSHKKKSKLNCVIIDGRVKEFI
jgi:hypothetical protein